MFTIRADAQEFTKGSKNNLDGTTPGRVGARVWRIAPETATPAQAAGTDASATQMTPSAPAVPGFTAPTA